MFVLFLILVTPEIMDAIALLGWFVRVGGPFNHPVGPINNGILRLWVGQSLYTSALVTLIVRARLAGLDESLEEAAADLGAHRRGLPADHACRYQLRAHRRWPAVVHACASTTRSSPTRCRPPGRRRSRSMSSGRRRAPRNHSSVLRPSSCSASRSWRWDSCTRCCESRATRRRRSRPRSPAAESRSFCLGSGNTPGDAKAAPGQTCGGRPPNVLRTIFGHELASRCMPPSNQASSDSSRRTGPPRIAIGPDPEGGQHWLKGAITAGGGQIVPVEKAEALMWTTPRYRRPARGGVGRQRADRLGAVAVCRDRAVRASRQDDIERGRAARASSPSRSPSWRSHSHSPECAGWART